VLYPTCHFLHIDLVFDILHVCCNCNSDPFADDEGGTSQDGYIHIRIQQRNGRKTLTTVQGISSEFDLKKIVKVAKKVRFISAELWII